MHHYARVKKVAGLRVRSLDCSTSLHRINTLFLSFCVQRIIVTNANSAYSRDFGSKDTSSWSLEFAEAKSCEEGSDFFQISWLEFGANRLYPRGISVL